MLFQLFFVATFMNLDSLLDFVCIVLLLCLRNTLITTNLDILKYIKNIFKISI